MLTQRLRCAVVGHPVSHSLSPEIHRSAYAELGLDWTYDRVDVAPGGLARFVSTLDASWRGLSVTMPHKEEAARLGAVDDVVILTGVANTLVFDPAGALARNTDVSGYVLALRAHGIDTVTRASIVGNGATARSALAAVTRLGADEVTVWCRTPGRAQPLTELGERVGVRVTARALGQADTLRPGGAGLLISTVPAVGVRGLEPILARSADIVFDSIYDPWPTPLGEAGHAAGRLVLNGLDLLAAQAVDQVRWFTGRAIGFATARRAAATAVAGERNAKAAGWA